MSLFSIFSSPSDKYSTKRHYISRQEISRFFNNNRWSSVSEAEEDLVENSIVSARDSGGKISIRRVYETLKRLEYKGKISEADRRVLMNDLENYLNQKFSD